MKNLKLYFYGLIALFFIGAVMTSNILIKKNKALKAENVRVENNNLQLMAKDRENTNLILTKDEFIGTISDSLSKTLKQLNIKPKTITKIVETKITETIRDTVFVPVIKKGKDEWFLSDTINKCSLYEADIKIMDDSLFFNRTLFKNDNTIEDIFTSTRPHKFLFFKWGKEEVIQTSIPDCGETTSKTIDILRK